MANRYTQVQFDNPVESFVPLPFQSMAMAAGKAQESFDEGKKLPAHLQQLEETLIPAQWHQDKKANLIKEYNSNLDTLVNEYQGNYADPSFKSKANRLISNFTNDPRVQQVKADKVFEDKYVTPLLSSSKLEDKQRVDRSNFTQQTDEFLAPKGLHNTPWSNPVKDSKDIMDNITASGSKIEGVGTVDKIGESYYLTTTTGGHKKIDYNDLNRIAAAGLKPYMTSPGGIWQLHHTADQLFKQYNINIDPLALNADNYQELKGEEFLTGHKDPITGKQLTIGDIIEQDLLGTLTGVAEKQIFKDISKERTYNEAAIENYGAKKKVDMPQFGPGYNAAGFTKENTGYDIDQFKLPSEVSKEATGVLSNINNIKSLSDLSVTDKAIVSKILKEKYGKDFIKEKEFKKLTPVELKTIQSTVKDYFSIDKSTDYKYVQPKDLSENNKRLLENVAKNALPENQYKAYKKLMDQGGNNIPNSYLKDLYTYAANAATNATKEIRDNLVVKPISPSTYDMFGADVLKPQPVKEFFAGIGTNGYIFDEETNQAVPISQWLQSGNMTDLVKSVAGKEPMARLSGELDPKNSITAFTNNKGFGKNGYQIMIGDKPFYITGGDFITNLNTGEVDPVKTDILKKKGAINDIWVTRNNPEMIHDVNVADMIPTKINARLNKEKSAATGTDVYDYKAIGQRFNINLGNGKTTTIDMTDVNVSDSSPEIITNVLMQALEQKLADAKFNAANKK